MGRHSRTSQGKSHQIHDSKKKKIKINERRQKELSKTMTAEQEVFNQV